MSSPPWRAFRPGAERGASGRFLDQAGSRGPGGSGPESASSSLRGAWPCRPGHPVAARVGPRRVHRRWSRPPCRAHPARTPGWPVRARLRHAPSWVWRHSAPFTTCRATRPRAPISSHTPPTDGAAVLMIETDSSSLIGPTMRVF